MPVYGLACCFCRGLFCSRGPKRVDKQGAQRVGDKGVVAGPASLCTQLVCRVPEDRDLLRCTFPASLFGLKKVLLLMGRAFSHILVPLFYYSLHLLSFR